MGPGALVVVVSFESVYILGAKVIVVRWVDISKGDAVLENYRPRLAAREIKEDDRPYAFAAAPPLEALQAIISLRTKENSLSSTHPPNCSSTGGTR